MILNKVIQLLLVILISGYASIFAQDKSGKENNEPVGQLQLGLRSTASMFNSTGNFGQGVGGQFRIRLTNEVNTDWFADYFTENLDNLGKRTDAHIGWSVVFYLNQYNEKWQPYLLAGHCFDYTRITTFNVPQLDIKQNQKERWSSAVQAGGGMQWNVTDVLNFTLQAQYMLHLGNDVHTHKISNDDINYLVIEEDKERSSLEGHLLLTFGMNVKIADLW